MEVQKFREISTRGRVAYAICCLEKILEEQRLTRTSEENFKRDIGIEMILLQQLWHFTSDNLALWDSQMVELLPDVVMENIEYSAKDYDFYSLKIHERLKKYYSQCNIEFLHLIELIHDIGRTNLYVVINSNELKEETLPFLQEIINIMNLNDFLLPSIELFQKFPITENNGWGREFTRDEIFKK